jgi:hypothetical protein
MDRDHDWESRVREGLKGRHLEEPSRGALRTAIALGGGLAERAAGRKPWWFETIFDSAAEPLPAGVRGAGVGERRLLYQLREPDTEEDTHQLDLRIQRARGGELMLTGQLLPPWSDSRVEARSGRTRRSTPLGKAGEFQLRGLPVRDDGVQLRIEGGEGQVLLIPDIPLIPPSAEDS